MNYFREAEIVLSHRKTLDRSLENLRGRRSRLMKSGVPQSITGLDPEKPHVLGGAVDDTMKDFLELMEVQRDIKITEAEIREIDDVLDQLSEDDKKILTLWYIDKKSKDEICNTFNYASRKSLYDRQKPALEEFSILYFGAPALNEK